VVASVAGLAMFWALVPLAVLGALRLRRAGQPLWPLVALIVIVTFNAAAFYGLTRFRVPAEVPLVVLAAVAIAGLRSAGGQQSSDRLSDPGLPAGQSFHLTSRTST
jgi:hypothetical protein